MSFNNIIDKSPITQTIYQFCDMRTEVILERVSQKSRQVFGRFALLTARTCFKQFIANPSSSNLSFGRICQFLLHESLEPERDVILFEAFCKTRSDYWIHYYVLPIIFSIPDRLIENKRALIEFGIKTRNSTPFQFVEKPIAFQKIVWRFYLSNKNECQPYNNNRSLELNRNQITAIASVLEKPFTFDHCDIDSDCYEVLKKVTTPIKFTECSFHKSKSRFILSIVLTTFAAISILILAVTPIWLFIVPACTTFLGGCVVASVFSMMVIGIGPATGAGLYYLLRRQNFALNQIGN